MFRQEFRLGVLRGAERTLPPWLKVPAPMTQMRRRTKNPWIRSAKCMPLDAGADGRGAPRYGIHKIAARDSKAASDTQPAALPSSPIRAVFSDGNRWVSNRP